jgi:hypothetical protein
VTENQKAPVSMRAIIQRINRKLTADGEMLRAARGERAQLDLGDYFVVDLSRNAVVTPHASPVALARKLGVLKPWERLEK